jgi:hypothetical protein
MKKTFKNAPLAAPFAILRELVLGDVIFWPIMGCRCKNTFDRDFWGCGD